MTRVRNSVSRENRETVIDDNELNRALNQANAIKIDYFRLRALAVLSLLRLSGKRRTEISWVQLENFKVENDLLTVTFTLEKKENISCHHLAFSEKLSHAYCR
jgi:site-specific recombinase XerD